MIRRFSSLKVLYDGVENFERGPTRVGPEALIFFDLVVSGENSFISN